jgi:alkylated DNA repair dioxygenase AlkB
MQISCLVSEVMPSLIPDLGPGAAIASLSLGTTRAFRLRQTQGADSRTYEVELRHNSLCLMTAGCQERYKHTWGVDGPD